MASPTSNSTLPDSVLLENRGWVLITESGLFAGLTTVVLALRFYALRFQAAKSGPEDWFLVAAYIVYLGMCVLGIVMTQVGGVGQHVAAIEQRDPALIVGWAKCILAFEFIYIVSVALPKLAVLSLYLRVFNWKGGMRLMALALGVLVTCMSASFFIAACFQCTPLAFWWDRTIPGGTCIDVQLFFHAQAIPGFLLDFLIMALPVRTVWSLNLPTVKRLGLLLVFIIASFGVVASILRAFSFFSTAALTDETFASVELIGWSLIETGTYIITACLPRLRPLISHYTPQWIKDRLRKAVSGLTGSNDNSHSQSQHRQGYASDKHIIRSRAGGTSGSRTMDMDDDTVELAETASAGHAESQDQQPHYYEPAEEDVECAARTADMFAADRWMKMREEAWSSRAAGTSTSSQGAIMVTTEVKMERSPRN